MLNGLITGKQPDVFFECRKENDGMLVPVSRHIPGNTLLRCRERGAEGIPHLIQQRLYPLRLRGNIGVYRFGLQLGKESFPIKY